MVLPMAELPIGDHPSIGCRAGTALPMPPPLLVYVGGVAGMLIPSGCISPLRPLEAGVTEQPEGCTKLHVGIDQYRMNSRERKAKAT